MGIYTKGRDVQLMESVGVVHAEVGKPKERRRNGPEHKLEGKPLSRQGEEGTRVLGFKVQDNLPQSSTI